MERPAIYETFGLRLAALRRERGLSQQTLAETLAVTRQAVSNWERGQTMPDLGMMERLCQVLEVDWNHLCGGATAPVTRRRCRLPAALLAAETALLALIVVLASWSPAEEPPAAWSGYQGRVLRSHLTTVMEPGPYGLRKQAAVTLADLLEKMDARDPVTAELRQAFDLVGKACAFRFLPAYENGTFEDRDAMLTWLYRGLSRGGVFTTEQADQWLEAWFDPSVRWAHGSTEHYTLKDGAYLSESACSGTCVYILESLERREEGDFLASLVLSETSGTGTALPERTLTLALTAENGQIQFSSVVREESGL